MLLKKIALKINPIRQFYELHSKQTELYHELSFPFQIVKNDQKIKIADNMPTVLAFRIMSDFQVLNLLF
jgi:hypothetical protein